jgi:dihydroorotate dehydrogenase electron transfer subunit
MVWLPGLDEKPFSLLSDAPLTFAIAAVGPFSRAVHTLREGDKVWCRGPFGHGFEPRGAKHVLVGGGYGSAPLLFLARRIRAQGGSVRAILGARRERDLLFVDAFAAEGAAVDVATEDGSAGTRGLVTDVVAPLLVSGPPDTLYACGPHGMLMALADLCRRSHVQAQLSWERYMRCGIGLCGSCEHEGRLVCTDGPVLDLDVGSAPF